MATLPDIDTAATGGIGWWNAIDHGASSLDPSELLSYSGIETYTAYDNGIVGYLNESNGLKWRAKTDGWIVVYHEASSYSNPVEWQNMHHDGGTLDDTTYAREINNLRQEASNSSNMTFNRSDVGLYDYEYTPSKYVAFKSITGGNYAGTGRWSYASGQKPSYLHIDCHVAGWGGWARGYFDGTEIAYAGSGGGDRAHLDAVAKGWIPNSGTFYSTQIETSSDGRGDLSLIAVLQ